MIAERTTRRGGFTLIELLVVIALIAILAALAAGTFFRIQAAEYERATAATLVKADSHLKVRWTATLEDAKKSVPPEVFALAGGDKDRATAIWTYAKLQSEFPESFDEVWIAGSPGAPRDIVLGPPPFPPPSPPPSLPVGGGPYVRLSPKKVFVELAKQTYTPAPTPDEQAAALFYVAINSTSVGGVSPQSDGLNNQTMTLPSGVVVYKDAWGTPITFRRWAKMPEMQSAPYLHRTQGQIGQFLITPAAVVILLAGIYLTAVGPYDFGTGFVDGGLAIIVILLGLGGAFFARNEERLFELAEDAVAAAGGGAVVYGPEYERIESQVSRVGMFASALVLVAVFLMVVKPGV